MNDHINRRRALALFGTAGLGAVMAACGGNDGDDSAAGTSTTGGGTGTTSAPASTGSASSDLFDRAGSCALTPEQTEGPYYLDIDKVRSDIREDRKGARLRLALRVRDAGSCTPVANAAVDIWHCDAEGVYSGYEAASTGGGGGPRPGGGGGGTATDNTRYLRGTQITSAEGIVEFITVYPGWYRGRTVHIHAKVHISNREAVTTQFYFDDDFTAAVYKAQPYAADTGRDTFNRNDGIYRKETLLTLSKDGDGYLGVFNLDVHRT
jgi:protocatechuate 3,4-dioxygenase beta subunit